MANVQALKNRWLAKHQLEASLKAVSSTNVAEPQDHAGETGPSGGGADQQVPLAKRAESAPPNKPAPTAAAAAAAGERKRKPPGEAFVKPEPVNTTSSGGKGGRPAAAQLQREDSRKRLLSNLGAAAAPPLKRQASAAATAAGGSGAPQANGAVKPGPAAGRSDSPSAGSNPSQPGVAAGAKQQPQHKQQQQKQKQKQPAPEEPAAAAEQAGVAAPKAAGAAASSARAAPREPPPGSVPVEVLPSARGKAQRVGSVVPARYRSHAELWAAVRRQCGESLPAPGPARLVYQDGDGDWLLLGADAPWELVAGSVRSFLVVARGERP